MESKTDPAAMELEAQDAVESMQQMDLGESVDEASQKPDDDDMPAKEDENADNPAADDDDKDDDLPPLLNNRNDGSDTEKDDDSSSASLPTTEQAEVILVEASSHKEEGNDLFKQGSLELAARSYRRGCSSVKKILIHRNTDIANHDQITAVHLALHTNLSMVLFQLQKFKQSADVASQALKVHPDHVKALYRRAVARRATGDPDMAKADLKRALQLEPKNVACRKELVAIQKDLDGMKEAQKRALAKAFSSGADSGLLYQDKEAAEKKRQEREKQRKEEEQERYRKRKQQWEDACVTNMTNNQPVLSFEEWEAEEKKLEDALRSEEEERRKEKQAKRKAEEKKRKQELKSQRKENDSKEDDSDDELTEKELAMMRGYKITKDGRKTSYFTRELSDEEKKHYDIAPKRLESGKDEPAQPVDAAKSTSSTAASTASAGRSAWNAAGTWEEKDTTAWCTTQLTKRLEDTTLAFDTLEVNVTEVKNVTGHASVAHAAGKKRYIFEYEAAMKYELKSAADDQVLAHGSVRLPDVESTSHDEIEVVFDAWEKQPPSESLDIALKARDGLAAELRLQVQRWVDEFNANY